MSNLNMVEMETLNTLIKGGTPLNVALSIVGHDISEYVKATPVAEKITTLVADKATKPAKSSDKKIDSKPVSKETKSDKKKSKSKTLVFGNVKKGDYFVNFKVENGKQVVNAVGYAKEIKAHDDGTKDIIAYVSKDGTKTMYALEKCSKISSAEYKKLHKKFGKKSNKSKSVVSTDKRLNAHDYTIAYAYFAKTLHPEVDYLDLAINAKSDAESANIRKNIKEKVNDETFKLNASDAVTTFKEGFGKKVSE